MSELKQIHKELRNLHSYQDVFLTAYHCPYKQKVLGGDVVSYAGIPNQSTKCKGHCDLCESEVDNYYEWMVTYDDESRQIPLNLCQQCNSPKEIWEFIFNDKSWFTKIALLIMSRTLISYELFFMFLIMDDGFRPHLISNEKITV